jgi:hypothetical protein
VSIRRAGHIDSPSMNIALLPEGADSRSGGAMNMAFLAEYRFAIYKHCSPGGGRDISIRRLTLPSWRRADCTDVSVYKHYPPDGGRIAPTLASINITLLTEGGLHRRWRL